MISGSTDSSLYLRNFFGVLTIAQENELRAKQIRLVEDLLFLDELTIDKLTEFEETSKKKLKTICKYLNMSSGESNDYEKSLKEMYLFVKNGGRERDRVTATDSNDTTSLGLVFRAKPPQKYNQLDTCDEENVTSSQSTRNKPKRNSRKHSLSYSIYFYLFWIFALFWPIPTFFWLQGRPDLLGLLHGTKTKHSENSVQKVEQKDEESKPQRCPGGSNSVKNCCCPQACTDAILDQLISSDMSCRTRINYLMGHHGANERDSCGATAEIHPICSACNPDKCPVPVEK